MGHQIQLSRRLAVALVGALLGHSFEEAHSERVVLKVHRLVLAVFV